MTTHKNPRTGPRMIEVITCVSGNPGCPKITPARAAAPYGRGLRFGYNAVNRCLAGGLIEDRGTKAYELYVTDKGRAALGRLPAGTP